MKKFLVLYIAAVSGLLALSGGLAPAIVAAQQPSQVVSISEKEYSLTPNKVTVKMGAPVQFKITNNGTIEHNFQLELASQNFEKKLFDANIKPGETKTAEFSFTSQGDWEMYCPIDGHEDLGMKGIVTVSGAISGAAPSVMPTTGGLAPMSGVILIGLLGLALVSGGFLLRELALARRA